MENNHTLSQLSHVFAMGYLYTWVERGGVTIKCLGQEHNVPGSPTQTIRAVVKRTNHEATMPPTYIKKSIDNYKISELLRALSLVDS